MNHKPNETMTHTHTPGPWELEHCRNEDGSKFITINGRGPHGAWLADIQAGNIDGKPADVTETHLANARLIASSPDLLAALEDAEFLLRKAGLIAGPMRDSFNRSASDARAEIDKARGKGEA